MLALSVFSTTRRALPVLAARSLSSAANPPPKSVPAASPHPAGVSSTPTPEEALKQHSQTSADELEPIAPETRAKMGKAQGSGPGAGAASGTGRVDEVAESRPTVEEAVKERTPLDTRTGAPNLARKTGQA